MKCINFCWAPLFAGALLTRIFSFLFGFLAWFAFLQGNGGRKQKKKKTESTPDIENYIIFFDFIIFFEFNFSYEPNEESRNN